MIQRLLIVTILTTLLSSCAYNPFASNNHLTGSGTATAIGAGVGVGTTALLDAPTPVIALAGIGGGALGYYLSSLRFASRNIIKSGGQVYMAGSYVGIDVPTDKLFEPNTADFRSDSTPLLESIIEVVCRYPSHSILISGNTSGFGSERWEQRLSENRAKQISAYLWSHGVSNFQDTSLSTRKLNYVGYGDYFPIANNITEEGIRSNSRIQITLYPTKSSLGIDKKGMAFNNIGAV